MSIYTLMPLHASLGLAVIGLDLGAPIDAETAENMPRLLAEHLVLVFPEQALTPEQYVAAAQLFGPPMRQHHSHYPMPGHPDIALVGDGDDQRAGAGWHTDHINRECPPAATMLYGAQIPTRGGGTRIADMRAAYWSLADDERARLDTLRTVNPADREGAATRPENRANRGPGHPSDGPQPSAQP